MQTTEPIKQQVKFILTNEIFPFIEKYLGDAQIIESFKRKSERLDEYHIAVIGKPGWGKSTLLNALIDIELLPTASVNDTTGVITYIYHQDEGTSITICYKNGETKDIDPQKGALDRYINKLDGKRPDVQHIEIRTPIVFMRNPEIKQKNISGLVLLDTPGEGSLAYQELSEATYQKMKEADAILAFVRYQRAETNDALLLQHLQELREAEGDDLDKKIYIIANQIDQDSEYMKNGDFKANQLRLCKLYSTIFQQIKSEQILGVSALYALLCRLLSKITNKAIDELTLADIEQHINILPPTEKKVWRDMKTQIETLNDLGYEKPIEALYNRSRIEKLENAVVKYLLHTDTKTAPTHQLAKEGMAVVNDITKKLHDAIEEQQRKIDNLNAEHRSELKTQVEKNKQRIQSIDQYRDNKRTLFLSEKNNIIAQSRVKITDELAKMHRDTMAQITTRINNTGSYQDIVNKVKDTFSTVENTHKLALPSIIENMNKLQEHVCLLRNLYDVEFRNYFSSYEINKQVEFVGTIERKVLENIFSENHYQHGKRKVLKMPFHSLSQNHYPYNPLMPSRFRQDFAWEEEIDDIIPRYNPTGKTGWPYFSSIGHHIAQPELFNPLTNALSSYENAINNHLNNILHDLESGELALFGFFDECAKSVKERLLNENKKLQKIIDQQEVADIREAKGLQKNIANLQEDINQLKNIHSRLNAILL